MLATTALLVLKCVLLAELLPMEMVMGNHRQYVTIVQKIKYQKCASLNGFQ